MDIPTEEKKVTNPPVFPKTGLTWDIILKSVIASPEYKAVTAKVALRRDTTQVFPPEDKVMRAFELCPYKDLKVVLLGQDPYPIEGDADGLAFSCSSGRTPASVRTMFREINRSVYDDIETTKDPDLSRWAKQGVLLLNTVLTVEKDKPNSHSDLGWQLITERIIRLTNNHPNNLVYILLGKQAQMYKRFIDEGYHKVLEAPHPAAETYRPGAGFIGSNIFADCNVYIRNNYGANYEIQW